VVKINTIPINLGSEDKQSAGKGFWLRCRNTKAGGHLTVLLYHELVANRVIISEDTITKKRMKSRRDGVVPLTENGDLISYGKRVFSNFLLRL
jgi:hypothetical protein